jgi:hypothetical protein
VAAAADADDRVDNGPHKDNGNPHDHDSPDFDDDHVVDTDDRHPDIDRVDRVPVPGLHPRPVLSGDVV